MTNCVKVLEVRSEKGKKKDELKEKDNRAHKPPCEKHVISLAVRSTEKNVFYHSGCQGVYVRRVDLGILIVEIIPVHARNCGWVLEGVHHMRENLKILQMKPGDFVADKWVAS